MNRFAMYSTFVLSAIAASIITSDFDIQSVRRVLSTKENGVDNASTPNSVKRNIRKVSKDSEASSSSNKSNQNSKTSEKKESEEAKVEGSNSLRVLKSGASEEIIESDASQEDDISSKSRSKSLSSKSKGKTIETKSEIVEISSESSKNSEDSEGNISSNVQRKTKGGSVSNKSDEPSLLKKTKAIDQSDISDKDQDLSGDKRDLTSESETEQDNVEENPREFRRGGRAMTKETLDKDSGKHPNNKVSKKSVSSKEDDLSNKDSSSAIIDEEESDGKEFRRGGRAMSLRKISSKGKSAKAMESDHEENNKKSIKKNSNSHASSSESKPQKEGSINIEEGMDSKLDDAGKNDNKNIERNAVQVGATKDAGSIGNEKKDPLPTKGKAETEEDEDNSESSSSLFSLADSTDILPGQEKVDQMVKEFRGGVDSVEATNKHTEKERYYRLMYGRSKPVKSSW